MSETKFTPGPWVGFMDEGKWIAILPAGRPGDICTFQWRPSNADGNLMTAAPDLYEALEPFAACVFNDNGEVTISTETLTTQNWLAVCAALSKARGEQ